MPGTDALIMDPEIVPTITAILSIHTRLFALQSLVPSPEVNGLFEDLMTICLRPIPNARSSRILSDPRIVEILPALHQLCSLSEFEMEKYWCKRITDSSNPNEELRKFTYFENYVDLTRLELAAIYALDTNPINNVAFIGSGPLPLTSICLMEQVNETAELTRKANLGFTSWILETLGLTRKSKVKILNIDHSPEAIKSSTVLVHNLGISSVKMMFSLSSASDLTSLKEYDVVFLAALVGSTQEEKEKVLGVIVSKMTIGALVVIRSVAGMRGLCYPAFDATTEAVAACIDVGVTVDPGTRVVNSVVVGRVRARE